MVCIKKEGEGRGGKEGEVSRYFFLPCCFLKARAERKKEGKGGEKGLPVDGSGKGEPARTNQVLDSHPFADRTPSQEEKKGKERNDAVAGLWQQRKGKEGKIGSWT